MINNRIMHNRHLSFWTRFWRTTLILSLIFTLRFSSAVLIGLDIEQCARAMGMESGRIRDEQLSASSSFDPLSTGPANARLNSESGSGAWCPRHQINASSHEWIQVELREESVIAGVKSQGRWDKGRGMEYPQAYMVEYWRESLGRWARYRDSQGNEIIRANSDTQSAVLRLFDGAVVAKLVRVIPVSESVRTVCLRFELFGCEYKDHLSSYSAPSGSIADALDLRDSSYDGAVELSAAANRSAGGGWMRGGLGRLFDGAIGEDNFEERPGGWVGWRAEELKAPFLPLDLFFSSRLNFSALLLHTSNFRRRGAHLPRSVRLHFAPFGGEFSSRVLQFDVPEDVRFETARWLRIPIPHRIASRIRVELYFAVGAEWLLISELRFESEIVPMRRHMESDDAISSAERSSSKNENFDIKNDDGDEDQETGDWMDGLCLLIVIISGATLAFCLCFCSCFLLLLRLRRPSHHLLLKGASHPQFPPDYSPHSSTSASSSASSSSKSAALFHLLLRSAGRRKTGKIKKDKKAASSLHHHHPPSSSAFCHQFDSLRKPLSAHMALEGEEDEEEGKELMDIAKMVIKHQGGRKTIMIREESARDGGDGDDSDQYAEPEEPQGTMANRSALPFSPVYPFARPSHLHYASRDLLRSTETAPGSDYTLNSSAFQREFGSPRGAIDSGRYRGTPTLAQFAPFCRPPPMPPPMDPPPAPGRRIG